jgi:hypothetical protein
MKIQNALELPEIYYEHLARRWWMKNARGGYISGGVEDVKLRLRGKFSEKRDGGKSGMDRIIIKLQNEHAVDYAGVVAGWPEGYHKAHNMLVTAGTPPLVPTYGGSTVIRDFRERLYGAEQAAIKHAWTKIALESLRLGRERIKNGLPPRWRIQQNILTVGLASHGKTIDGCIDMLAIAGKENLYADPTQAHHGDTTFNEDLSEHSIHLMDDSGGRDNPAARRAFGEALKKETAAVGMRVHGKGRKATTKDPFRRRIILINDKQDDIRILPPMEHGMADKFILLKTIGSAVDVKDGRSYQERMDYYMSHVSDYVGWLETWEIPEHLRHDRYGVVSYHNEEVLSDLVELGDEVRLMEIISLCEGLDGRTFTAGELYSELQGIDEVRRMTLKSSAFGKLLAAVSRAWPHIVEALARRRESPARPYRIHIPSMKISNEALLTRCEDRIKTLKALMRKLRTAGEGDRDEMLSRVEFATRGELRACLMRADRIVDETSREIEKRTAAA